MANRDFQMTFDAGGRRPITWHHTEGDSRQLRQLLKEHRFSDAGYEGAENATSRAEFDDFQRYYTIRMYDMAWQKADSSAIQVTPFYLWVDNQVIISWVATTLTAPHHVRKKLQENPEWIQSSGRLAYYLLDEMMGQLFPFLDGINDQIARLEQRALKVRQEETIKTEIFGLKREILRTRRVLASMRDAVSQIVRYWSTNPDGDSFYYMELYDHMIRLFDTIDTYRELVNSVLDLYMSTVSNRLNEIVKTLTLVTTVLLPASLMAALYGMNFDYLPLAHYKWGFLVVMGIIGAISSLLYWLFRRRRWL